MHPWSYQNDQVRLGLCSQQGWVYLREHIDSRSLHKSVVSALKKSKGVSSESRETFNKEKRGVCLSLHTKGQRGRQDGQEFEVILVCKAKSKSTRTTQYLVSKTTIKQNKSQGSLEAGVICFSLAKMMNMHPHILFYCITIIITTDSKYRATEEKIQKKMFYCTTLGL